MFAQSLQLCPTLCDPWPVACEAPLSMWSPGKNTGVGCHFLLQGNLLNPGMEPKSSVSAVFQADSLLFERIKKPVLCDHFSASEAWKGTTVEESAPDNIFTAPNSEGNEEEEMSLTVALCVSFLWPSWGFQALPTLWESQSGMGRAWVTFLPLKPRRSCFEQEYVQLLVIWLLCFSTVSLTMIFPPVNSLH